MDTTPLIFQQKLHEFVEELDYIRKLYKSSQVEIQSLTNRIHELERLLEKERSANQSNEVELKAALTEAQVSKSEAFSRATEEVERLRIQLSVLEKELMDSREQSRQLQLELRSRQKNIENLEQLTMKQSKQIQAVVDKMKETDEEYRDLLIEVRNVESSHTELKQYAKFVEVIAKESSQLAVQQNQVLVAMKSKYEDLLAETICLRAQRHAKPEDIRKEDSSLLVQIQILKQNIEKLSKETNDLRQALYGEKEETLKMSKMVTESVKASKVCDEELTRLNHCLKEEQTKMNAILVSKSMLEEELEEMKAEVGRKEKLFREAEEELLKLKNAHASRFFSMSQRNDETDRIRDVAAMNLLPVVPCTQLSSLAEVDLVQHFVPESQKSICKSEASAEPDHVQIDIYEGYNVPIEQKAERMKFDNYSSNKCDLEMVSVDTVRNDVFAFAKSDDIQIDVCEGYDVRIEHEAERMKFDNHSSNKCDLEMVSVDIVRDDIFAVNTGGQVSCAANRPKLDNYSSDKHVSDNFSIVQNNVREGRSNAQIERDAKRLKLDNCLLYEAEVDIFDDLREKDLFGLIDEPELNLKTKIQPIPATAFPSPSSNSEQEQKYVESKSEEILDDSSEKPSVKDKNQKQISKFENGSINMEQRKDKKLINAMSLHFEDSIVAISPTECVLDKNPITGLTKNLPHLEEPEFVNQGNDVIFEKAAGGDPTSHIEKLAPHISVFKPPILEFKGTVTDDNVEQVSNSHTNKDRFPLIQQGKGFQETAAGRNTGSRISDGYEKTEDSLINRTEFQEGSLDSTNHDVQFQNFDFESEMNPVEGLNKMHFLGEGNIQNIKNPGDGKEISLNSISFSDEMKSTSEQDEKNPKLQPHMEFEKLHSQNQILCQQRSFAEEKEYISEDGAADMENLNQIKEVFFGCDDNEVEGENYAEAEELSLSLTQLSKKGISSIDDFESLLLKPILFRKEFTPPLKKKQGFVSGSTNINSLFDKKEDNRLETIRKERDENADGLLEECKANEMISSAVCVIENGREAGKESEVDKELEVAKGNEKEVDKENEIEVDKDKEIEVDKGNEIEPDKELKVDKENEIEVDKELEIDKENEIGVDKELEVDKGNEIEVFEEIDADEEKNKMNWIQQQYETGLVLSEKLPNNGNSFITPPEAGPSFQDNATDQDNSLKQGDLRNETVTVERNKRVDVEVKQEFQQNEELVERNLTNSVNFLDKCQPDKKVETSDKDKAQSVGSDFFQRIFAKLPAELQKRLRHCRNKPAETTEVSFSALTDPVDDDQLTQPFVPFSEDNGLSF
ncbi:girdin-like isoform X2 [Artemia franciscana]